MTQANQKIFLVSGMHFTVPGRPLRAFTTLEKAQFYALELANLLREWVELPLATDPKRWDKAAETARRKRALDLELEHVSFLEDDPELDGWVEITQVELDSDEPARPAPTNCPSNHWNDGNDICADCGESLQ